MSPTRGFSLSTYFLIRQHASTSRTEWDNNAAHAYRAKVAKDQKDQDEADILAPFWYDKVYGTNYHGLNGRIPKINEINERKAA